MARKLTALLAAALVWVAVTVAVLVVVGQTNDRWTAQAGFALVAAAVGAAWAVTELLLSRFGVNPPYRPR